MLPDSRFTLRSLLICDADEGTCADIYGHYVSTTGALLGSEFIINNDEGNQMGGFVGQAVNGRLFGLINTGVNMLQDSWGDVYGVFFDVSAISGRVYVNIAGHSDLGVRNAVVSLQGTQYSVSTDSNGNFNLANIPFGTYTLIVTAPNMNTITQIVSYTGQSLSIMLPPMTVFHCLKGDANDDAQLGLDDAVYILQTLAGLRPVGEIDVTGLWNVTVVSDKGGGTFTMDLTQSGNSVSGTTLIKGYSGTVSGSINGSDISLVVADPDPDCSGSVGTLTGTVSGNTMSGSHSSIAGGTCPAESGTWTATR
jgi:hypothetical protein